MKDRFQAVDCPSCGAPIQVPAGEQRFFTCQFCGTTLEDLTTRQERDSGQQAQVVISAYPPAAWDGMVDRPPKAQTKTNQRGCLVSVSLLLLFIGGIAGVLLFSGGLIQGASLLADPISTLKIYGYGATRMLPSDNDTQPDLVAVARHSDATLRLVYVDFESQPHLRWQSEPLGEGADYIFNPLIADPELVLLVFKNNLIAFDRGIGTLRWQSLLSDEISVICEYCLQVMEERIIVLSADGVLAAYDRQTGDQAWSLRLNETPRQLIALGGRIGVLDDEDGQVGINVYTPTSGELVARLIPQCPNDIFPDSPQTLGIYDPLFLSSDGTSLYVLINQWEPGCLQHWDTASLSQSWQASVPGEVLDAIDWYPYLFTEQALFLSTGQQLYQISLADGSWEMIFSIEDYELSPLTVLKETLLVQASRTRGTEQFSLFGINPSKSGAFWQYQPDAQEMYSSGSTVVYSDGLWSVHLNPEAVVLLEAFSEPGHLEFTLLDHRSGAEMNVASLEFQDDGISYWFQIAGWSQGGVYVVADDRLSLLDPKTGTLIAQWP